MLNHTDWTYLLVYAGMSFGNSAALPVMFFGSSMLRSRPFLHLPIQRLSLQYLLSGRPKWPVSFNKGLGVSFPTLLHESHMGCPISCQIVMLGTDTASPNGSDNSTRMEPSMLISIPSYHQNLLLPPYLQYNQHSNSYGWPRDPTPLSGLDSLCWGFSIFVIVPRADGEYLSDTILVPIVISYAGCRECIAHVQHDVSANLQRIDALG